MKKLTAFILSTLLLVTGAAIASSQDGKHKVHGKQGNKMAMKHVNPMPNFMKVVVKFGDQLNLTAKQDAALADWRKNNGKAAHELVSEIIKAEKKLAQASYGNSSQAELQDLMDKVLGLRSQMAKGKMRCRENMRSVLNEQQWSTVSTLYQQKFGS